MHIKKNLEAENTSLYSGHGITIVNATMLYSGGYNAKIGFLP